MCRAVSCGVLLQCRAYWRMLWVLTLSGSLHRLAGWWRCFPWAVRGIILWGRVVGGVSCAGVDGLYEALPFRQCRAFFLKCRCGWAGWVSAWAGASLCGCCAVGGVCILCRSVVPVVVVRGVSCGAVRGLSRGLLRVCYTKGLQGLLNALYGAFVRYCGAVALGAVSMPLNGLYTGLYGRVVLVCLGLCLCCGLSGLDL